MTSIIETARGLWRGRQATAAVEFAIITPVLLVLLVAVIDMARLMHDFHTVDRGLRDATRYLSRIPMVELDIQCPANTLDQTAIDVDQAKEMAMTGYIGGTTNLLKYWDVATDKGDITVSVDCKDNTGATIYEGVYGQFDNVPRIMMSAQVDFPVLVGQIVNLSAITMRVSHSETHIGD